MICFDTSPLIWAVRGEATSGQEEMIQRAKRYIQHIDNQPRTRPKERLMMFPAPALSEYLTGCRTVEQRSAELAVIERHFMIPALDIPAAVLAAEIHASDAMRALRASTDFSASQLRIDTFILAIAILNNATRLITNNQTHFRRLAAGRLEVSEIPDVDPPQGLLELSI